MAKYTVIFLLGMLALASAMNDPDWNRRSNPFMRLSEKVQTMLETGAQAQVNKATMLEDPTIIANGDDEVDNAVETAKEEIQEEEVNREADAEKAQEEEKHDEIIAKEKQEEEKELEKKVEEVNQAVEDKERQAEQEIQQEKVEAKAQMEYEKIKEMAKSVAEKTIENAKKQADLIMKNAELEQKQAEKDDEPAPAAEGGCGQTPPCPFAPKKEDKDFVDAHLLIPLKPGEDKPADLGKLEDLSVRGEDFRHGEEIAKEAEGDHEAFKEKHEEDCQGSLCPFAGTKIVVANTN